MSEHDQEGEMLSYKRKTLPGVNKGKMQHTDYEKSKSEQFDVYKSSLKPKEAPKDFKIDKKE